jgi:hypothetical protein
MRVNELGGEVSKAGVQAMMRLRQDDDGNDHTTIHDGIGRTLQMEFG